MENVKKNPIFNTAKAIYKTVDRLSFYRKHAKGAAEHRADKGLEPAVHCFWKYWRRDIWTAPNNTTGKEGQRFTDYLDQIGDFIGESHKLISFPRNWCTGYYADVHLCAVIKFGVCRLRSARGTFYIPVIWPDDADGCTHYLADAVRVEKGATEEQHADAIDEAARAADSIAEREAEREREYSAEEEAERDIEEAVDVIHSVNVRALALIREIKAAARHFTPAVCSALRAQLSAMMSERAAAFETIEQRRADKWTAVSY